MEEEQKQLCEDAEDHRGTVLQSNGDAANHRGTVLQLNGDAEDPIRLTHLAPCVQSLLGRNACKPGCPMAPLRSSL